MDMFNILSNPVVPSITDSTRPAGKRSASVESAEEGVDTKVEAKAIQFARAEVAYIKRMKELDALVEKAARENPLGIIDFNARKKK